jgi:hypothetical protein
MLPSVIGGSRGWGLSPKFVLGSFVTLKFSKLDCTTVKDAPNVHLQKSSMLAGSASAHSAKNKNGHVTGNDIVQLDAQRPPRQLHTLLEKPEHLLMANVVAGQRTLTRHMPPDFLVQNAEHSWNIAAAKRIISSLD